MEESRSKMHYGVLIIVIVGAVAFLIEKKVNPNGGGAQIINAPNNVPPDLATYAKNPQAFYTPANQTVNVNVANQSMGYLNSSYIPLFGFVGMAQGRLF